MTRSDLVVVGGGIIGSFAAYFAALRGFNVTLIEAGSLGNGASGRCAGIHTTQLVIPVDVELSRRSLGLYREVAPDSVHETGFLSIEPSWMSEYSIELLRSSGVEFKVFSSGELHELVGWIKVKEHEVGLYTPGDAIIDVGKLFSSLKKKFREQGIKLLEWTEITGLDADRKRLYVNDSKESIEFDFAVFAAGAWNRDLLNRFGLWREPVLVYACQVLSLNTEGDLADMPVYIEESHLYLRKFGRNSLLVGNGFALKLNSPKDCPSQPSREFVLELGEKLSDRLTKPEHYRLAGGWAGVCSSSPDGLPIIGRVPGYQDLFLVDALDGYGLMRGPALSQDLIEYLASGQKPRYFDNFSPSRFNGFSGEPDTVIELHSRI